MTNNNNRNNRNNRNSEKKNQGVSLQTMKTEMMEKIAASNMNNSEKEQLIGRVYLANSVNAFYDIIRRQQDKYKDVNNNHPNHGIKKVMNESVQRKNNKNSEDEPWYKFWGGYRSRKNTRSRKNRKRVSRRR